jgi:hypothetical protein
MGQRFTPPSNRFVQRATQESNLRGFGFGDRGEIAIFIGHDRTFGDLCPVRVPIRRRKRRVESGAVVPSGRLHACRVGSNRAARPTAPCAIGSGALAKSADHERGQVRRSILPSQFDEIIAAGCRPRINGHGGIP